jgi:hypothetical protein
MSWAVPSGLAADYGTLGGRLIANFRKNVKMMAEIEGLLPVQGRVNGGL